MPTETTLTRSQQARRSLMLSTTLEVLNRDGYAATKIQDIANESGIALATIYRYFTSRDKLIRAATSDWLFETTIQALPPIGEQRVESRLIKMVRHSAARLGENPRLLEAWVRSMLVADQAGQQASDPFSELRSTLLPRLTDDEGVNQDLAMIINHVWLSGIVQWTFGNKEYHRVHEDVERSVLLVLNAHRSSTIFQQPEIERR